MADEQLQAEGEFYIVSTTHHGSALRRVLKHGETFGVFDGRGDVQSRGREEQGLYHEGARHLSHQALLLWDQPLLLLSSSVTRDNTTLAVDLMSPDVYRAGQLLVARGTVHVFREKFLWQGRCYERLRLTNFSKEPLSVELSLEVAADFVDLFEVRGKQRSRRGAALAPVLRPSGLVLRYRGLDQQLRTTRLSCSPAPSRVAPGLLRFDLPLEPARPQELYFTVVCDSGKQPADRPGADAPAYLEAIAQAGAAVSEQIHANCEIRSSNELVNEWVGCSLADLRLMITRKETGLFPYAGIPWFSAPFGRDAIITALEALWVNPDIARGVLQYLALHQASELQPERDAEPGKILHESRLGEMAALGEIPFGRYYGSADATPLFVLLAGEYLESSGDLAFIQRLWPHLERALQWIDESGDLDADGFVEYARRSSHGLAHQGWKDSHDAVFHADGGAAKGPIALCEVQAYVYGARRAGAAIARALGREDRAAALERQADELRERFDQAFWSDELSSYALALDGAKQPCLVRSSNAGHCLFTGIAKPERAHRLARTLLSPLSFSGWGIRTIANSEAGYNPMSYHNGSVWPHDNALIAQGLARYGYKDLVSELFTGLFDTSNFVDLHRLPELFCGFRRRAGQGPTLYPVACSPQAWAAAAVFMLIGACLGLSVHGLGHQVRFASPLLPAFIGELHLRRLRVGQSTVDISLRRIDSDVAINILSREGPVEILVSR